jgi:hypothetical protein
MFLFITLPSRTRIQVSLRGSGGQLRYRGKPEGPQGGKRREALKPSGAGAEGPPLSYPAYTRLPSSPPLCCLLLAPLDTPTVCLRSGSAPAGGTLVLPGIRQLPPIGRKGYPLVTLGYFE